MGKQPERRKRCPELLIGLGMALFYAVFLLSGATETVEVAAPSSEKTSAVKDILRDPAVIGGGALMAAALFLAFKAQRLATRRQLLLMAMGCALLAVWQALNHRHFGLFAAGGGVVTALSLFLLACNRNTPNN